MSNEQLPTDNQELVVNQVHKLYQPTINDILEILPTIARILDDFEQYDKIELVNTIANCCHRMLRTSTNVTAYHKLMQPVSPLLPKKILVNDFLDELLQSVRVILSDTDFTLEYDPCDEKIITEIDDEYLSMAIFQLISNSCNFSPKASTIRVLLRYNNDNVNIIVIDQGDGIQKDELEKVFTPYYSRSHKIVPLGMDGVGLGLPIVQRIATLMGGKVIISSGEFGGTAVTISVPIDHGDTANLTLKANTSKYVVNRRSPLYALLSDVCHMKIF